LNVSPETLCLDAQSVNAGGQIAQNVAPESIGCNFENLAFVDVI